jgi:hypothetical protein
MAGGGSIMGPGPCPAPVIAVKEAATNSNRSSSCTGVAGQNRCPRRALVTASPLGISRIAMFDEDRRRHPDSIDRQPAVTLFGRPIGTGPASGGSDTGLTASLGVRIIIRRRSSISGFSNQR